MTFQRLTAPRLQRESLLGERSVGWLELFYDLVYVASLIQIGQGLVEDVSVRGATRFVALFFLLWWAWTGTTFYMNRVNVDDVTHRMLVIVQMIAIAAIGTEADRAFETQAGSLALAYGVVRLTITTMYVRAARRIPEIYAFARRYAVFFGTAAVLWLVSAAVPSPYRFALWATAIVIDGARVLHPDVVGENSVPPDREHMLERYALFTIIVLGESFIKTIGGIADQGVTIDTQVMGALGLAITAALWWTYFDDVADSPIRARGSGRASTVVWVYAHLPLTMGLTAVGVGVEKLALSDMDDPLKSSYVTLLSGAVIGVLASIAAIDAVTVNRHFAISERDRLFPRIAAIGAVVAAAMVLNSAPSVVLGAFLLAIVAGQIGVEDLVARRREGRLREVVAGIIEEGTSDRLCDELVETEIAAPTTGICVECAEKGMVWVHLRSCAACGQVGCCDDSDGRHAREHFKATGHPVIRSIEDGDSWVWCYVHERALDVGARNSEGRG